MQFEIDFERLKEEIVRRGAKIIGIQLPEGLKHRSREFIDFLNGLADEIIISGETSFGACDIDVRLLQHVDLLLHVGHTPVEGYENKVLFVEALSTLDVSDVVRDACNICGEKICVVTTAQHVHKINEVVEIAESMGKYVMVLNPRGRAKYPAQILGCDLSCAKAECDDILYVGSGNFHPKGACLASKKRVVIADPYLNEVREIRYEDVIRERITLVERCRGCRTFGVLIGMKNGQHRPELARKVADMIEEEGMSATLVSMDVVTPDKISSFRFDCWVNTACPRISIDDYKIFEKPIITPFELEILMGRRRWDEYLMDEF